MSDYRQNYLGHVAEEMTKQYVDYMPKKIEKANDNYFDKPENNIALTITPKKRRYRHEKEKKSGRWKKRYLMSLKK